MELYLPEDEYTSRNIRLSCEAEVSVYGGLDPKDRRGCRSNELVKWDQRRKRNDSMKKRVRLYAPQISIRAVGRLLIQHTASRKERQIVLDMKRCSREAGECQSMQEMTDVERTGNLAPIHSGHSM
jgi:hypothetical protein